MYIKAEKTMCNRYHYGRILLEFISASDLETIARRYNFEPLCSTNDEQFQTNAHTSSSNIQWMNSGVVFTDKTIGPFSDENETKGLSTYKEIFV